MERQSRTGKTIAISISALIAGAMIFCWLRELDLTFLARFRAVVAPVVVIAGVILGMICSYLLGKYIYTRRECDKDIRKQLEHPRQLWILPVFGILMATRIPEALLDYWRVAVQVPMNPAHLTDTLFHLCYLTIFSTCLIAVPLLLLCEIRTAHRAPVAEPG
ncbi:MAG: hypothetical protein ACYDBB_16410 [Armatimonadota bacterium]